MMTAAGKFVNGEFHKAFRVITRINGFEVNYEGIAASTASGTYWQDAPIDTCHRPVAEHA
jgi:hypothetical protein